MYQPKTKPFAHQSKILAETQDLESYALFWEMGCGKTKPIIDTIGHLHDTGKITGALVLAPKAVAPNWVADEIPAHLGASARVFLWDTSKAGNVGYQKELRTFLNRTDCLSILVMSYNAIMTESSKAKIIKGKEAAKQFLTSRPCMMVLDESARIKEPSTQRAKRVLAAGKHAKYRRILTGTPVSNSPFDVFAQVKFLDPKIWEDMGCASFQAFKHAFGDWVEHRRKDTGRTFPELIRYKNLNYLNETLDKIGSRLLKSDVLDLPAQLYSRRTFDMSTEQRRAYDALRKEAMFWLDSGDMVTAPLMITRMLRMQQVASGYCPTDEGSMIQFESNPRMECLQDIIEDIPHQAIIWAKFRKDIENIAELLGKNCVVYDGSVSQADREERRSRFKSGDVQFFVGNPAAAGEGLTLHEAKTVVYYNTTYKLSDRLQSEARAHRAGMDSNPVNYIDIVASESIDEIIIDALRNKQEIAAIVTGDKFKEWI